LLLLSSLLVDAGLRLLPVELLSFRTWEAATRYAPFDAPFEPNRQIRLSREHGDLSNLANLPALREYRPGTTFSTDLHGFRNQAAIRSRGDLGAILIGDSFAVGGTVGDDDTLAVQLGRLADCPIYNAGGLDRSLRQHPDRIVSLARRLGISTGLVIDEYLEGGGVPGLSPEPGGIYDMLRSSLPATLADLLPRLRGFWTVSPLRILLNRSARLLEDDRILPNSYASSVVQRTLPNGDKILFLPQEVDLATRPPTLPIEHWIRSSATLASAGLSLIVVLVPQKYTVYESLLLDADGAAPYAGEALATTERRLRDAGVPVINLLPAFRAAAAIHAPRAEYLYWRDDTHWNPRGIALAASEIWRSWTHELSRSCRNGRGA
jgi:hypothetical protein